MSKTILQSGFEITRRNLPHWESAGAVYFVTWRSVRGELPEAARECLEKRIYAGHGVWFTLYVGVIMPDHVHLIIQPLPIKESNPIEYPALGMILRGIKGSSARDINALLGTTGSVWQDERFDRIIRNEKEFAEKYRYILYNPVKAGLIQPWEMYRFYLWPPEVREIMLKGGGGAVA